MRAYFYQGRIVSFEPLRKAFGKLDQHARRDPLWVAENFALGDTNETRAINVAGNSASSSFLEMLPAHLESAPESHYVGGEEVRIRMLDDVFHDYVAQGDRVLLKADTQGYERNVLLGARGSLAHIELVQLEVSLRPLYDGDLGVADAIEMLAGFSFVPVSFEPGFTDKTTGKQLQANIIFQREN
jgi:FkbM family methyltransferase